ncbi:MAG: trypsin-like peptidase domain-containing protein [Verrucomicrobiota bacterium]
MKTLTLPLIVGFSISSVFALTSVNAQSSTTGVDFAKAYEEAVDSVVYIETGNYVGEELEVIGFGSGFILHKDGYIATAAHVVESRDVIGVQFHGHDDFVAATIVNISLAEDLALLKVDGLPESAKVAKLAEIESIRPAQPVFCIGAPRGLKFTVTTGVVSAIREYRENDYQLYMPQRVIQTDVAINPGNSGGPIFNTSGEVIGVAVLVRTDSENIGFAVPTDLVCKHLVKEAIPFAGVIYRRLSAQDAEMLNYYPADALLIERVQPGSLAEKAGLRGGTLEVMIGDSNVILGGDVIYEIGGNAISDIAAVRDYLRNVYEGEEINCLILRGGEVLEAKASFEFLIPLPDLDEE